jgi:Icc-related predicted phosphoesterase
VIRIAAVGDLHVGVDSAGSLHRAFSGIEQHADVLLLAGDLTRRGEPREVEILVSELRDVRVPILAVLGNHDHHSGCADVVTEMLDESGVRLVDGAAEAVDVRGIVLGVAGTKGFGGGFVGASGSDFGEKEMKAFVRHSMELAAGLEAGLRVLAEVGADLRVALTHYSPVRETLEGEPAEIYPFLGSFYLAEAIDAAGADLALHGHAHRGAEFGATAGGVPVRNVAQPVIDAAYRVYELEAGSSVPSGVGAGEGARGTDS